MTSRITIFRLTAVLLQSSEYKLNLRDANTCISTQRLFQSTCLSLSVAPCQWSLFLVAGATEEVIGLSAHCHALRPRTPGVLISTIANMPSRVLVNRQIRGAGSSISKDLLIQATREYKGPLDIPAAFLSKHRRS